MDDRTFKRLCDIAKHGEDVDCATLVSDVKKVVIETQEVFDNINIIPAQIPKYKDIPLRNPLDVRLNLTRPGDNPKKYTYFPNK